MSFAITKDCFKVWFVKNQAMSTIADQERVTLVELGTATRMPISVSLPAIPMPLEDDEVECRHFLIAGHNIADVPVGFYDRARGPWEARGCLTSPPVTFDTPTPVEKHVHLCDLYSSVDGYRVVFRQPEDAVTTDGAFMYYTLEVESPEFKLMTLKFALGKPMQPIDVASWEHSARYIE